MKSVRQRRLAASVPARRLSKSPRSQRRRGVLTDLARVERAELQIADASRERLARLPEQIDRRRAQDEEAARPVSAAAAFVDEPAEAPEELRGALDLVEDDQLVRVLRQVELRLGELCAVGFGLQIEIDRRPCSGDFMRQRGLARLTRPQQRHRRNFGQGGHERREKPARDHPCNYGATLQKCKDAWGRCPARAFPGTSVTSALWNTAWPAAS